MGVILRVDLKEVANRNWALTVVLIELPCLLNLSSQVSNLVTTVSDDVFLKVNNTEAMRGKIVWWGELFREEKEKEGRERGQENTFRNWVLSASDFYSMYVCAICSQCPQRPEDGVGFSGTEHECWESNPDSLAKRPVLSCKAVSSPARPMC